MPVLFVRPTVHLSSYAQAHQEELTFGPSEALPTQVKEIQTRNRNWFSRSVKKMDNSSSIAMRISKILLKAFLLISLIGIPVLILWKKSREKDQKEEKVQKTALKELNIKNAQWNQRAEIRENIGVQDFANLPILDLKGRVGETGYIDFLEPADLSAPVMKGLDRVNRPFIAIKMENKSNAKVFVMVLFQRYIEDNVWTWIGTGGLNNPLADLIQKHYIGPEEEKIFAQIIQGNHPQFRLAIS